MPDFRYNLLSISRIGKYIKCSVNFYPRFVVLQDMSNGRVLQIGREANGLYTCPPEASQELKKNYTNEQIALHIPTEDIRHQRLGHVSDIIFLSVFKGNCNKKTQSINNCKVCPLAKQHRLPFSLSENTTKRVFEMIHMDV